MRALLTIFCLALAAPWASAAESGMAAVSEGVSNAAKDLVSALKKRSGKVGVLAFNPVSDASAETPFGQALQDQFTAELAARRKKAAWAIVERREIYKVMEDSRLFGPDEELFDKLREKVGMDYAVSGSYAATEKEVTVTVGLLNVAAGVVEASGRFTVPNDPALARLMRARRKPASEPGEKVSLEIAAVYLGNDNRFHPIRDGTVLTAEDQYALYLKAGQDCWVYVYQTDTAGSTTRLFPNAAFQTASNPLKAGREVWAPNDKSFFFLDESKGSETIHVIASRERNDELEELVSAKSEAFQKTVDSLKLMGVGGAKLSGVVKAPPIKGGEADLLTRRLAAGEDFVYSVTFDHR